RGRAGPRGSPLAAVGFTAGRTGRVRCLPGSAGSLPASPAGSLPASSAGSLVTGFSRKGIKRVGPFADIDGPGPPGFDDQDRGALRYRLGRPGDVGPCTAPRLFHN